VGFKAKIKKGNHKIRGLAKIIQVEDIFRSMTKNRFFVIQ